MSAETGESAGFTVVKIKKKNRKYLNNALLTSFSIPNSLNFALECRKNDKLEQVFTTTFSIRTMIQLTPAATGPPK